MFHLYTSAFSLGVQEELEKFASCMERLNLEKQAATDMGSMPVNENILPSISNQARWKYVRTKDGLRLSDGNLVYSFGLPGDYPHEDTKVSRLDDDNILNFESDAVSKGTAQIHRSSPDNIYMTLADGSHNPTFMLQHEEGKNWRYSPSKKFLEKLKKVQSSSSTDPLSEEPIDVKSHTDSTLIDPESFMLGAKEAMLHEIGLNMDATDLSQAMQHVGERAGHMLAAIPSHPATTMLAGGMAGLGVNALRRKLDPTLEEREKFDPRERKRRVLYPLAAATLPLIAGGVLNASQNHA